MKTDEFWQQVSDVIIECDDCPVKTIVVTDEQFKIVADTIVIPAFRINSSTDVKKQENG